MQVVVSLEASTKEQPPMKTIKKTETCKKWKKEIPKVTSPGLFNLPQFTKSTPLQRSFSSLNVFSWCSHLAIITIHLLVFAATPKPTKRRIPQAPRNPVSFSIIR